MTTPEINGSLLAGIQLHGFQAIRNEMPDADREHSLPSTEHKGLWTDGLPDHTRIKERMDQCLQEYLALPPVMVTDGNFRQQRWLAEVHRRQNMFHAEMMYYEDLLYAAPVPVQAQSTTTVVPYQPVPKRKPGRPSTGGRQPRNRRKRPDDEPY